MTEFSDKELLTSIFRSVKKYGYHVRKYKIDGKDAWANIEKKIIDIEEKIGFNIPLGGWTPESYSFYTDLLAKGVVEEVSPTVPHGEWIYHHFLLQHGRLARKECHLNRLLQIAYNAGQFEYCIKNDEGGLMYNRDRLQYYVDRNLNNINSYINLCLISFKDSIKIKKLLIEFYQLVNQESELIKKIKSK